MRIVFLIRKRTIPGTAIANAASYDCGFLAQRHHMAEVITVNESDEVRFVEKPDVIVIENAGWVPPAQIAGWVKCNIAVIVRVHAAPEFLYYEMPGMCTTSYIAECEGAGAKIAFVSSALAQVFKGIHLPITYPMRELREPVNTGWHIHIGMFGALRPLKNHIGQMLAVAQVKADFPNHHWHVHINSTRIEDRGSCILPELKALARRFDIDLVPHAWEEPHTFITSVVPAMTAAICASMAESFCLTAADFVSRGVPTVLGHGIPWAGAHATKNIAGKLSECLLHPEWFVAAQRDHLFGHIRKAKESWAHTLEHLKEGHHVPVN